MKTAAIATGRRRVVAFRGAYHGDSYGRGGHRSSEATGAALGPASRSRDPRGVSVPLPLRAGAPVRRRAMRALFEQAFAAIDASRRRRPSRRGDRRADPGTRRRDRAAVRLPPEPLPSRAGAAAARDLRRELDRRGEDRAVLGVGALGAGSGARSPLRGEGTGRRSRDRRATGEARADGGVARARSPLRRGAAREHLLRPPARLRRRACGDRAAHRTGGPGHVRVDGKSARRGLAKIAARRCGSWGGTSGPSRRDRAGARSGRQRAGPRGRSAV